MSQQDTSEKFQKKRCFMAVGLAGTFMLGAGLGKMYTKNKTVPATQYLQSSSQFANINKVTYGYNLIQGNPVDMVNSGNNDGMSSVQLFDVSYSAGTTSSGNSVPNGYQVTQSSQSQCQTTSTSQQFLGMHSYGAWLESIASFDSSAFGFGFGANPTTADYLDKFYGQHLALQADSQQCPSYVANLDTSSMPAPSQDMISALEELAMYPQDGYLNYFFNNFGTHYMTQTTMGSATYSTEFVDDVSVTYNSLEQDHNQSKQNSNDYNYVQKEERSATQADKESYENRQQDTKQTMVLGSSSDPVPISYSLSPIYELITSDWLVTQYPQSSLSQSQLQSVASAMQAYAQKYCVNLYKEASETNPVAYCGEPQPDPTLSISPQLTNQKLGTWGPLLISPSIWESTWYFMSDPNGYNNYVSGICAKTQAGGKVCYPESTSGYTATEVVIDGPIVGIDIIEAKRFSETLDVAFVYLDKNGEQVSKWARNESVQITDQYDINGGTQKKNQQLEKQEKQNWNLIQYRVPDNGYMIGLAASFYEGGNTLVNFVTYNAEYPGTEGISF